MQPLFCINDRVQQCYPFGSKKGTVIRWYPAWALIVVEWDKEYQYGEKRNAYHISTCMIRKIHEYDGCAL